MQNDERQRGRVLTRRELLALIGAAGRTLSRLPGAMAWSTVSSDTTGPGV